MKKVLVCLLLTVCVLLMACGKSGGNAGSSEPATEATEAKPDLNTTAIHEIQHPEDKTMWASFSLDQDYSAVKVVFQANVDNDDFTGTAECTWNLGPAKAGQLYKAEVSGDDEWAYSGTFKNVGFGGNGQPQITAPDMTGAPVKVIIMSGDTELASSETE